MIKKEYLKDTDYELEQSVAANRIEMVADPAGKLSRNVMRFELHNGDVPAGTSANRTQLLSFNEFNKGETGFIALKCWVPTSASGGPEAVKTWMNLWEFFTPPYNGSPQLELGLVGEGGVNKLRWTRNGTYGFDEVWRAACPFNQWFTVLYNMKYDTAASGGFIETFINGVSMHSKVTMNVYDTNVGSNPAKCIPQTYHPEDGFTTFHCYYDKLVIATTKAEAEYWASEGGGGGEGPEAPVVITKTATSVSTTEATLNSEVNPKGQATEAWFRYGTDSELNSYSVTPDEVVGSGTSAVAKSKAITGLTPGTKYYFRAVAENATGKTLGAIQSFTAAASEAEGTKHTTFGFNGTTSAERRDSNRWAPNNGGATGIFIYDSATGEDSPNDAGIEPHMVAIEREGASLTNGEPYWEWTGTWAQLGIPEGATVSAVKLSFDWRCDNYTLGASSQLGPATLRDSGSTLRGTFAASSTFSATSAWATKTGSELTGLSDAAGTTIKLRVVGIPKTGAGAADVRLLLDWAVLDITYSGAATAPVVTTKAATGVGTVVATLSGEVNPKGQTTLAWFRYGTDPELLTYTMTADESVGSGGTAITTSANVSGLKPSTKYYFRAAAENSSGKTFGSILNFTTLAEPEPPTATTKIATSVTTTTATLSSEVNPHGEATKAWFQYSTEPSLTSPIVTAEESVGSGTSSASFSKGITGLKSGTKYYYRVVAKNGDGETFGEILSFTATVTEGSAPTATTKAAAEVRQESVQLNGEVNPKNQSTLAWFRYGTDSELITYSVTSDVSIGSGSSAVPCSSSVGGLKPNTKYYFRQGSENASGKTFGSILNFTTGETSTNVTLVPDQDLETSGWESTPLYSKIDDDDDTTTIHSTLA